MKKGSGWASSALRVLVDVMKEDLPQTYFNDPVDPEAMGIPEYRRVIKKPMDLGTVKAKLLRGDYEAPYEVLQDVNLIWSNCRLFNTPGSDVVDASEDVEKEFKRMWKEEGLHKMASKTGKAPLKDSKPDKKKKANDSVKVTKGRNEKKTASVKIKLNKSSKGDTSHSSIKTKVHGLRECIKLIKDLMEFEDAEAFKYPVDPVQLGCLDYYSVIDKPMDLTTILENLQAAKVVGWENICYKDPKEVKEDINLIWSNCRQYNNQEEDVWIREICDSAEKEFDRLWRQYKLDQVGKKVVERKSLAKKGSKTNKESKPKEVKQKSLEPKKRKKNVADDPKANEEKKKKVKKVPASPVIKKKPMPIPTERVLTDEQVKDIFALKPNSRCPVCKVQKKGSCGTETSPMRCYRRQFNGLPYTELTDDEMHKFAYMVSRKASAPRQRKSKAEMKQMKISKQLEHKQVEVEKSREKLQAALYSLEKLKDGVAILETAEENIAKQEIETQRKLAAKKKYVSAGYVVPPLSISQDVLALGNFFWSYKPVTKTY